MVRIVDPTTNNSKYRIRYGLILISIAVVAGLVVVFDQYEQAVISRQATETLQRYVTRDLLKEEIGGNYFMLLEVINNLQ